MRTDVMLTAFGLGLVTGMRSLRGIAALAVEQKDDTRGWLRSHPYWKAPVRSAFVTMGERSASAIGWRWRAFQ